MTKVRRFTFWQQDAEAANFFIDWCKKDGLTEVEFDTQLVVTCHEPVLAPTPAVITPTPPPSPIESPIAVPGEVVSDQQRSAINSFVESHILGRKLGEIFAKYNIAFQGWSGGAGTESEGRCIVVSAPGSGRSVLVKNDFSIVYSKSGMLEKLGAPVGLEFGWNGGARQEFERGYMTWMPGGVGTKVFDKSGNGIPYA